MDFTPGDIVEIETQGGLAYVHVTHIHPSYPPVVRALPGLHDTPIKDLASLVSKGYGFTAMIPLETALARSGMTYRVAGRVDLPAGSAFPTFRMPIRDKAGTIVYWWLWDGSGLTHTPELTAEQATFPTREVMSAATFFARLQMAEVAS